MNRLTRFLPAFLFTALSVAAQGVDHEKAVQQATEAGDLAKAEELCARWIAEKPDNDRPHIVLGKLYARTEQLDEALAQFEMARDLNPQSPEPFCGAAGVFLKSGMPEDAITEFKAALGLRPDYAPALKGLAEAEALLANAQQDGVWIRLGEINDECGLRLVEGRKPSRVVTIGGRECRATDKGAQSPFLYFDVDDDYLFDVDFPVRVTVEYCDLGTDLLQLKYDSTDTGAHEGGAAKAAEYVRMGGTKTWKEYTFNLPDARFATENAWDFAINPDLWRGETDIYVSSVHVVLGGLAVTVDPKFAATDGTGVCVVAAKVVDAQGPVPDGTLVTFDADRGTIPANAKTFGGEAKATFEAGTEPGEATITVRTGEDRRTVTIPILRGSGAAVRRRLLVHRFGGHDEWEVSGTEGTLLTVRSAPEHEREGRPSTRVTYRLSQDDVRSNAGVSRTIPLPGRPAKLGLWMDLDGSPNTLRVELSDATGQVHVYQLGSMAPSGWRWLEFEIGPGMYHHSGANDGDLHFPLQFRKLLLRRYYGKRPRQCEGEVYLQDLTVETDVPASETILLDVTPADPRALFDTEQQISFLTRIGNMTAEPLRGRIRWLIMAEEDDVVAEGSTEELEIASNTRVREDIALDLAKPGVYRVRFTLATSGEETREPSALPSEEITVVLLRKMTDLGISADTQPTDNGLTVRLTNQGAQAARVALSYRVLNQKNGVLRRGALGRPDMEMAPGESLECPLTIEGLPPDRYSILLLLDAAGDQRCASLLSHEVFPTQVTLTGRVVGADARPIPGASIRARLLKRPHPYSTWQDESIRAWETETDKDGQYVLEGMDVPGNLDVHHLYVEAVANGYVDVQRIHSLRSLVASRRQAAHISTLRLTRGVELTGRVIGGDGEPVPDASVCALTAATAGVTTTIARGTGGGTGGHTGRQAQSSRPRMTDAGGRFKLPVPPEASTKLAVYSSQWAATWVTASAKQPDLGDIQLERGTVVSGTFLDGGGKPVVGYWVVAAGLVVSGTGSDEEARPAAGHRAIAGSIDGGKPPNSANPVRVAAKTGSEGAFALPPLKGRFSISTPESFLLWVTEAPRRSPPPRLTILPQTLDLDGTRDRLTLELRAVRQVPVSGRVLDVDGTPAEGVGLLLHCADLGSMMMPNCAVTNEDGRFVFEGIPHGLKDVSISAPGVRAWKRNASTYLKPKPLAHVVGARDDGTVHVEQLTEDLTGVDFQYQFWRPEDGFLAGEAPGPPAEERVRGEMAAERDVH